MTPLKNNILSLACCSLIGGLSLLSSILINPINHYINALILIIVAIILYLCITLGPAKRNWLDIRAVFSLVWIGTIGLATFRLINYQEPWQNKTWVILSLAYIAFMIGSTFGMSYGADFCEKLVNKTAGKKTGSPSWFIHENRLFLICLVTTLIGFACFIANVLVKGYIPCFSESTTAYLDFYTKFHIFSTAATAVSGLCFYCIRTQPLKIWKKILLGFCILYLVFLFPIMVVSRGTFIVAALSLIASVFYTCGKRFWALVLSIILVLGVYLFTSVLRNYTNEQLSTIFQSTDITQPSNPKPSQPSQPSKPSKPSKPGTTPSEPDVTPSEPHESLTFELPPRVAFLYGYITVSHDNFNEAVQNTQHYTLGVRQLSPFNVILRSDWIEQANADAEYHLVTPNLNTTNLIGDFYYDFGWIGVLLFMLFWPFIFGIIQGIYERTKNPFTLLLLGNTLSPVVLCFFACWMSNFTFWMFWGVAILLAFIAYIPLGSKK